MQNSFDFQYVFELLPTLFRYLGVTMEMALWGFVFALILALGLALVRVFKIPLIQHFSSLFISFFRGTPLLVQLFLLYYGLPQISPLFLSAKVALSKLGNIFPDENQANSPPSLRVR